jgi:N-acetylglucosaminyl-diphospho-decaprenol L-rhamnosyltransferase
MADQPVVSVIVVTFNGMPWMERCLESVAGADELIVVDHGSTDGTLELVRERFPRVRVIEQENRGMGGGNTAGMRLAAGRYFLLLNSDAWVVDRGVDELVRLADARPDAAVVGPRLRNVDGSLQRSVRAFPTLWRLATEYLFLRKLAPRTNALNALYGGSFDHNSVKEVDWLYGACLLVRREAADAVGLFDEDFFMFSEEVDWCYRFRAAGWKVLFDPAAEVVHVGGASHGGRMYRENVRGHLRFFAKHYGMAQAERARKLLLLGVRVRARLFPRARREAYLDAERFLASGSASTLLRS